MLLRIRVEKPLFPMLLPLRNNVKIGIAIISASDLEKGFNVTYQFS